jgi:hypothetical protein
VEKNNQTYSCSINYSSFSRICGISRYKAEMESHYERVWQTMLSYQHPVWTSAEEERTTLAYPGILLCPRYFSQYRHRSFFSIYLHRILLRHESCTYYLGLVRNPCHYLTYRMIRNTDKNVLRKRYQSQLRVPLK